MYTCAAIPQLGLAAIVLVAGFLLPGALYAQLVFGATGSEGSAGALHIAWTTGEPLIATGTSAGTIATQGFHQPPADFSTAIVPVSTNADWQLFPNPTRGLLHLSTTESEAHHAVVLNTLGQHVGTWPINISSTTWSVDHLASGTYRLQVFDHNENELYTLPFIVAQ